MKYTQIPSTTFQELQLNAGILASAFVPASGTLDTDDLLGATSGGVSFTATPEYADLGDGIDNCPKNLKELKRIIGWDIKLSGTYVMADTARAKALIGAADIDPLDTSKIVPRNELSPADFDDVWWVGDYSDKNGDANGGFIAIHLLNALSTGGFQLQSGDKSKGQFAFEYTAHFSAAAMNVVPFELFIKPGTDEPEEG